MKRSLSALAGRWAAVTVAFVVVWACTDNSGPGHAPTIRIISPTPDLRVLAGDTVVFRAEASDSVDGSLTGASIVWFIDDLPAFGSGDSTGLRVGIPGQHVITARATNRDGVSSDDRVPLSVGTNAAPIITTTNVPLRFFTADSITLVASASDLERAVSKSGYRWLSSVDGDLGVGDTLVVPPNRLSVGPQVISAIATDPEGLADTTRVSVTALAVPDRLKWHIRVQGAVPGGTLINLGNDGTIVFGLLQGPSGCSYCLWAFASNGVERWHRSISFYLWAHSSGLTTSPAGTVYAFTYSGNAHAFASDGTPLWQRQILSSDPHGRWALSPDGALYATGNSVSPLHPVLERVSPVDGSVMWAVADTIPFQGFHSQGAFVDPQGRIVAALSPLRWVQADGSVVQTAPDTGLAWANINRGAMGADGAMYLSTSTNNLVAVAPDGSRPWVASFLAEPSEPVIDAQGIVYVASSGEGGVRALRPADGSVVWQTTVPGVTLFTEPALTSDGGLVLGLDNAVYVLSTTDGTVRWKVEIPYGPDSSFVIGADGTIYFVTQDAWLFALKGDAPPPANAPWVTYRADNRGTASVLR